MKITLNSSHRELLALKIRRDSNIHKSLHPGHYNRYRKPCIKGGYWKITKRHWRLHKMHWVRLSRDPKLPLVPKLLFKQLNKSSSSHKYSSNNKTQTQRIYHIQINSYLSNNKSKKIQETINSILLLSKGITTITHRSLSLLKSPLRMLLIVDLETF